MYLFPFIIVIATIKIIVATINLNPFLLLIEAINFKVLIKNLIVKLTIIVIIIKSFNFILIKLKDLSKLNSILNPLNFACNSVVKITLDFQSYLSKEEKVIDLIVIIITIKFIVRVSIIE